MRFLLLLALPLFAEVRLTQLRARADGPRVTATLLIENTNDNTANLDVRFEVRAGGKLVAEAEKSLAAPPLLTTGVEAELTLSDPHFWDFDDPFLYEVRAKVHKHSEPVEGAYDRETTTMLAIRSRDLLSTGGVGASGVTLLPEHLHILREAGILVVLDARPSAELQDWANRNGLVVMTEAPAGFAVLERFVPLFSSVDGHPTPAYHLVREKHAPAILRTITEVNGVTRIEVEARRRLRGYTVRVGNQEQGLRDLAPGERVMLDFPSVNPYRVEIRSPGGFIVAER